VYILVEPCEYQSRGEASGVVLDTDKALWARTGIRSSARRNVSWWLCLLSIMADNNSLGEADVPENISIDTLNLELEEVRKSVCYFLLILRPPCVPPPGHET